MKDTKIVLGKKEDVEQINKISRQYPDELSFLRKTNIERAIKAGYCHVAICDNKIVGFILFHRRKDQTTTVYDLAVDKFYTRQGIGRALLYSVPHPVQLKCKQDNPANDFYLSSGMFLAGEEVSKSGSPLNIFKRRVLFIFVAGNNRRNPEIANYSGMAYVVQQFDKPRAWPFFLDVEFDIKKQNWSDYLEKVKQLSPVQAMVVDYMDAQKKDEMLEQVNDLRKLNVLRICVCPKFPGAIDDIPEDCVIALSTPARSVKFKGWLPPEKDLYKLRNRQVHLLGGSPQAQAILIDKVDELGGRVTSVDGNGFQKAARFGSEFTLEGKWYREKNGCFPRGDLYETQKYSGKNIVQYLNLPVYIQSPTYKRYKKRFFGE